MRAVEIVQARYDDPVHARAIVDLPDAYANDPFGGAAVGLANCLEGFSTFRCALPINSHDLMAPPAYRSQRLAQQMMRKVEQIARQRGRCKITLEVLEGNHHAQRVYAKMDYAGYQLQAEHGKALLGQKNLG